MNLKSREIIVELKYYEFEKIFLENLRKEYSNLLELRHDMESELYINIEYINSDVIELIAKQMNYLLLYKDLEFNQDTWFINFENIELLLKCIKKEKCKLEKLIQNCQINTEISDNEYKNLINDFYRNKGLTIGRNRLNKLETTIKELENYMECTLIITITNTDEILKDDVLKALAKSHRRFLIPIIENFFKFDLNQLSEMKELFNYEDFLEPENNLGDNQINNVKNKEHIDDDCQKFESEYYAKKLSK